MDDKMKTFKQYSSDQAAKIKIPETRKFKDYEYKNFYFDTKLDKVVQLKDGKVTPLKWSLSLTKAGRKVTLNIMAQDGTEYSNTYSYDEIQAALAPIPRG
jgi:hypothetical protein